jgi:hypothetical protein
MSELDKHVQRITPLVVAAQRKRKLNRLTLVIVVPYVVMILIKVIHWLIVKG